MWQVKKKMNFRVRDPPMAKIDFTGNLITNKESLKSLYLRTYQESLDNVRILNKHEEIYSLKMRLWESRCESLKKRKSNEWDEKDVLQAWVHILPFIVAGGYRKNKDFRVVFRKDKDF